MMGHYASEMDGSPGPNHNSPPSPIDYAKEVIGELSGWMSGCPVVQTEEDSRQAKLLLDRAKAALEDVERERDGKVRPLNDEVAKINSIYKAAHNIDPKKPGAFDKIVLALKQRVHAYLLVEEAKRRRVADEKRAAADAAREAALEAERLEREAAENAAVGEVGIDIATVTAAADDAFSTAKATEREAARAERDADKVRLAGGFGKSLSIRNVEVLEVEDWRQAIDAVGLTDHIRNAILTAARNFRIEYGELPKGVISSSKRSL